MPRAATAEKKPIHPFMGGNVRFCRDMRGLTQVALAELAGLSLDFLKSVETGRANLSYPSAKQLADCLDVPIEYIWDHRPPPRTP